MTLKLNKDKGLQNRTTKHQAITIDALSDTIVFRNRQQKNSQPLIFHTTNAHALN